MYLRLRMARRAWFLLVPLVAASAIEFEEVARQSGVGFRHHASKSSQKYLLEAMGAGVAMFDFDADGRLDLYFINGADLAEASDTARPSKTQPQYWNRLYRNLGAWRFQDVTEDALVAGREYGMGAAVADYDGDGDADLFVTNYGPDILFRNEGNGTFRDITREAGIGAEGWSSGAAFLDYDNDGHLDLFVARYLDWTFEGSMPCGEWLPEKRSYCHPRRFGPVEHVLYRNLGDGSFEDVSEVTDIARYPGKGLGLAVNDFDGDGWADLFVANDSYPQQLFRNLDGKRFVEVAVRAGAAYDSDGLDYAGMGVAWEDMDGDSLPDLLVNALGRQGYWLYRNLGQRYEPVSVVTGIAQLSELRSGWGMGLVDLDNDGWRDLLVAQGHVMDDISDSDPKLAHEEPMMLARNLFGRFYDVSGQAGPAFATSFAGRGVAFGDLDGDGRLDAAVNVNDDSALVLRNVSSGGNSVSVRLEGSGSNRDGIGARVTVTMPGGPRQQGFRSSAGSYLSSNSPDLHFGLGPADTCESIAVRWPDGSVQILPCPNGHRIVIRRTGSGDRQPD